MYKRQQYFKELAAFVLKAGAKVRGFILTTKCFRKDVYKRQDHYTIRAGRNLPDKEFRYLRTVIVTAADYWGFYSMLLLR